MTQTTETLADLAPVYQRIAVKWLIFDRGMTVEEAHACVLRWPDHGNASEAVDVATFIVEECHGE